MDNTAGLKCMWIQSSSAVFTERQSSNVNVLGKENSMLQYTIPEKMGIPSENIAKFIEILEKNGLSTHDVILSRGDQIVFEKYWEPFGPDFLHRMYSVSKSFVSIAIGFLEQEGKINLDDPIVKYFPEESKNQTNDNMRNTTIRHMLMMSTAKTSANWFTARTDDRVRLYFENDNPESRPSGTIFEYDSSGNFVMGALVERITGMKFMEYLREKLFRKIGVSEEAYCLECPGGHSWGDSAVLCTARDLWKVARFVLNRGSWNGEQILNEEYLIKATTKQIDNNPWGVSDFDAQGYGYQFWMGYEDSFWFNGMGGQYAVCVPHKDIILIHNADNQGKESSKKLILDSFYEWIVKAALDEALPENKEAEKLLAERSADLKLAYAHSPKGVQGSADLINGIVYSMEPNPMGITRLMFVFEGDIGKMEYTNAQGDKTLEFGIGHNVFGLFPQEGYSDLVGSVTAPGRYYKCAASAAWAEPLKLVLKVQIIDTYFGNLNMVFGFREDKVGVYMCKSAEDFLDEYVGFAGGTAKR